MFRLQPIIYKALLIFNFDEPTILGHLGSTIVRKVTIKATFIFYVSI